MTSLACRNGHPSTPENRRPDGRGLTRAEIAAQLDITRSALTQWAQRRGIELPVVHGYTPPAETDPVDPAETRIIGDRGWVHCGIHGDVPRTGSLRLTVPHNRTRLARILALHAHCHVTYGQVAA